MNASDGAGSFSDTVILLAAGRLRSGTGSSHFIRRYYLVLEVGLANEGWDRKVKLIWGELFIGAVEVEFFLE